MRHVVERRDPGPLSEPVYLILSSLAAGPRHGYAILQDVETLSGSRVRLSTGTLYGALRRLLQDGWIRRFAEKDASRDRQAYELTPAGLAVFAAEVERIRHLAQIGRARLQEAHS